MSNQWGSHYRNTAKLEIQIMETLAEEPSSPAELAERFPNPCRRLRDVLRDLKRAKVVTSIEGTHLLALRDL